MPLVNVRFEQLKKTYLDADFECRSGSMARYEFNKVIIDTIIGLLERFDEVEPYYTELKTAADLQWAEADKFNYLKKR